MSQRYYSLDVFRGATIALMILVNNPGSWSDIFSPLKHAPWHGCTPTDLVFPFFLFAVGNAMAFVIPKLRNQHSTVFWQKILKRTALIFFIGLMLNWWPFIYWSESNIAFRAWVDAADATKGVRILGVLQRIALCYCFASIIVYFLRPKAVVCVSIAILLLYWAVSFCFGGENPYSLTSWFGTAIDKQLLGEAHMYRGEGVAFEPEGLVSTFPATVQVIIGYLVGNYIRYTGNISESSKEKPYLVYRMISLFMVAAALLTFFGLFWGLVFPINKKIWTSSYVLYAGGLALTTISTMIWFIEIKKARNWLTGFFDVFGKNPLFIFVMSALIPKTLALVRIKNGLNDSGDQLFTTPLQWFYVNICAKFPGPPEVGSLIYALCFLLLLWAICYLLDKNSIYIKV